MQRLSRMKKSIASLVLLAGLFSAGLLYGFENDPAADVQLSTGFGKIYSDGTKIYLSNWSGYYYIYNQFPTTGSETPDVTLSGYSNYNWGGLTVVNNKFIATNCNNNRVLIFDPIPNSNVATASLVIGQTNLTNNTANQGLSNPTANTLYKPTQVCTDGTRLIICDSSNHRVLIYNTVPTNNNANANVVIGQSSMTTNSSGTTAQKFNTPWSAYTVNGKLFIVDSGNHRVLIYNSIPTVNNASADIVVGQTDMLQNSTGTNAYKYSEPRDVFSDGVRLFTVDRGNNRALIYNTIPSGNGIAADIVIGHSSMTSNTIGDGNVSLTSPEGLFFKRKKMFISAQGPFFSFAEKFFTSDISKKHGTIDTTLSATVRGREFYNPNVQVKLVGSSAIVGATNVQRVSVSKLTCEFSLPTVPGVYDLQLNDDGAVVTSEKAFIVLDPLTGPVRWELADCAQLSTPSLSGIFYGLDIGDADNNGLQELITCNRDLKITNVKKTGNVWGTTSYPTSTVSGEFYSSTLVCDADQDGKAEVYGATLDNHIYQFKANGTSWDKTLVGQSATTNDKIYSLAAGDGNGDGYQKIYAACADGHVYQFVKNPTWQRTDLGFGVGQMYAVACEDGNGDGELEVYGGNADRALYQFKYNGVSWIKSSVGFGLGEMYAVAVGDGNHDGQMEVYGANQDGKVYQFKWQITSWSATGLGSSTQEVHSVVVNDADNDGQDEVYAAGTDAHVYQFKYTNQWATTDLGVVPSPIYRVAVGDGNNDNQFEVYALAANNHIYQLQPKTANTPTPTATSSAFDSTRDYEKCLKILHSQINPSHGEQARIRWYQFSDASVTLVIYNMVGDKITTLADNKLFVKEQFHEIVWDGKNSRGEVVGSGIYIVSLQSADYKAWSKAAVIK